MQQPPLTNVHASATSNNNTPEPKDLFLTGDCTTATLSAEEYKWLQDIQMTEEQLQARKHQQRHFTLPLIAVHERIKSKLASMIQFYAEQQKVPEEFRQRLQPKTYTELQRDVAELHTRNAFRDDYAVNANAVSELVQIVLFALSPDMPDRLEHDQLLHCAYMFVQQMKLPKT